MKVIFSRLPHSQYETTSFIKKPVYSQKFLGKIALLTQMPNTKTLVN